MSMYLSILKLTVEHQRHASAHETGGTSTSHLLTVCIKPIGRFRSLDSKSTNVRMFSVNHACRLVSSLRFCISREEAWRCLGFRDNPCHEPDRERESLDLRVLYFPFLDRRGAIIEDVFSPGGSILDSLSCQEETFRREAPSISALLPI